MVELAEEFNKAADTLERKSARNHKQLALARGRRLVRIGYALGRWMIRGYESLDEGGLPMLREVAASLLLVATLAGTIAAEPIDNLDASHGRAGYSATEHLPRLHKDADQGSPLAQYV